MESLIAAAGRAVETRDGRALAALLDADARTEPLASHLRPRVAELGALCARALPEPFDELLASRLRALSAAASRQFVEAFAQQDACVSAFHRVLQEGGADWLLPALHVVDRAIRRLALQADAQLRARGEKADRLHDAVRILTRSFTITITDRAPLEVSKKWGALAVINELFRVYFRMNNLRLCANLIRAVDGTGFPPFEQFPMAQKVTYKYYVGRLSMLNANFTQAEEQLMYAFEHCPRESLKNKRLCLMYLVPTRLVLGKLASVRLLAKYALHHYAPLCAAVSKGDLRAFNEHKETHQSLYIQQGVYLIVERAKTIVYRNLFRQLHALIGSNKLSLVQMAAALSAVGVEMDVDELECILANLIYLNYVKGYISHQKRFLVVSAKDPFPALSAVALAP
ncbi:hypothetical protein KFE25_012913 [Diacronema lutheri]|uniref:PCI domain-containing protein n=1 Tax=Diacronema lutheri TaxID=2081491 RepID=A0A8J5X912_DIALT|nr:hypothetical protein KFE25_012913 [Diacronema lutheri]